MCVYIYIYIYTYDYIYTYVYVYTCMYDTCVCVYIYIYIYLCLCACTYSNSDVWQALGELSMCQATWIEITSCVAQAWLPTRALLFLPIHGSLGSSGSWLAARGPSEQEVAFVSEQGFDTADDLGFLHGRGVGSCRQLFGSLGAGRLERLVGPALVVQLGAALQKSVSGDSQP